MHAARNGGGPAFTPMVITPGGEQLKSSRREFAKLLMTASALGPIFRDGNGLMARGHSVVFESNADLCTLLEAVASGDRKAFRALYDKSAPVLFAICVRLMRDRDLAQDMLQEAMTRIWRKAHLFDASKGNAMAWMAVVTRNCALSRLAAAPPPSFSLDEAGVLAAVEARSSDDPAIAADVRECLKMKNIESA